MATVLEGMITALFIGRSLIGRSRLAAIVSVLSAAPIGASPEPAEAIAVEAPPVVAVPVALPLQEPELPADRAGVVYAKILIAGEAPAAAGAAPAVETWIARQLRRRGAEAFRPITGWRRVAGEGEGSATIWDGALDGRSGGCAVEGHVTRRKEGGEVTVALTGWAPFPAKIRGNTLPAEVGSRAIATVDPGRGDGVTFYVALLVAPAE